MQSAINCRDRDDDSKIKTAHSVVASITMTDYVILSGTVDCSLKMFPLRKHQDAFRNVGVVLNHRL
jgi:hypothetical protein